MGDASVPEYILFGYRESTAIVELAGRTFVGRFCKRLHLLSPRGQPPTFRWLGGDVPPVAWETASVADSRKV